MEQTGLIISKEHVLLLLSVMLSDRAIGRPSDQSLANRLEAIRDFLITEDGLVTAMGRSFEAVFISAAKFAWEKIAGKLDRDGFATILLEKHKRYGAAPLQRWGALGIVIRIDSKLARYENLTANPSLARGTEGTWDTLVDILGYAVLGAALIEQDKGHR